MPDVALTVKIAGAKEVGDALQSISQKAQAMGQGLQTSVQPLNRSLAETHGTFVRLARGLSEVSAAVIPLGGEVSGLAGTISKAALAGAGASLTFSALGGNLAKLAGPIGVALSGFSLLNDWMDAIISKLRGWPTLKVVEEQTKVEQQRVQMFQDLVSQRKLELDLAQRNLDLGRGSTAEVAKARALYIDAQERLKGITREKSKQLAIDLQIAQAMPERKIGSLAEAFARASQTAELLGKIAGETNAQMAADLQAVYDRFAKIPGAGKAIGLELLGLQARIADLRRSTTALADELDSGLLATLKDAGKAWEGMASEAERAAGRIGRSTALSVQAAATVQAVALEEALAATRRTLIAETQAYQDALTEATAALDDWNKQNAFDAHQQAEIEAGFQRRLTILGRTISTIEDAVQRRQAEVKGLQDLKAAIEDEIAALQREITAKLAAGIPTDALTESLGRLKDALEEITSRAKMTSFDSLIAAFGKFAENARQAFEGIRGGFETFFSDILSGTQSLGEALGNLWKSIANSIIQQLARIAANQIFEMLFGGILGGGGLGGLFGGLFGPAGGVGGGHQRGGELIVTRPTLMSLGEAGAERVNVTPLSGPASRQERRQAPSEAVTIVNHWNIQAVDAGSFVALLSRNERVISDVVVSAMRKNSALGKLLGGAAAP